MNEKIIPFTYNVKADKRRAYPLFFTLLFISGVLMVFSMTADKYSGIISLFAVVGLTASVMVYQRYVTSDYGYVITGNSESPAALLVTKRIGKRTSTMAYLPLYSVISIQKFTKQELKEHKTEKSTRKYNFAPTFSPDSVYLISARTPDAEFEIVLECIPEVAERILEYSSYAREDEIARRADEENEDADYDISEE